MTTKTPFDPDSFGYAINPTPPNPKATHRTRLNAYRHGLTGQTLILTEAEKTAFDAHCDGIVKALAPVGALEIDLAQAIAENRWRLKRIRAIESGIFAAGQIDGPNHAREDAAQLAKDEAITQARTWLFKADKFQLLALYEQRINRTVERNMAELRAMQAVRASARQQALEEAQLLAQLAKSKGETYNPADDEGGMREKGFPPGDSVFSSAEIERFMARQQRLDEARALPKNRQNPSPSLKMPAAA